MLLLRPTNRSSQRLAPFFCVCSLFTPSRAPPHHAAYNKPDLPLPLASNQHHAAHFYLPSLQHHQHFRISANKASAVMPPHTHTQFDLFQSYRFALFDNTSQIILHRHHRVHTPRVGYRRCHHHRHRRYLVLCLARWYRFWWWRKVENKFDSRWIRKKPTTVDPFIFL